MGFNSGFKVLIKNHAIEEQERVVSLHLSVNWTLAGNDQRHLAAYSSHEKNLDVN